MDAVKAVVFHGESVVGYFSLRICLFVWALDRDFPISLQSRDICSAVAETRETLLRGMTK